MGQKFRLKMPDMVCSLAFRLSYAIYISALRSHHNPRWNPDLREWFCAVCGRTSDHVLESAARVELDAFDCKIIAVHDREMTEEEKNKWRVTKKLRNKF